MELQQKPHLFTVDSPGPSCGVLTLQMLPSHGKSPTWFSWGNRPSCCRRDHLCWWPRALAPPLPRAGPRFSFPPHLSLSFGQLCAGALSAGAGLLDTAPCPDSRAAPAVLCFSQTPPRFPEIPAHPSPSKYPLRSSALFPVSLFAFPLFPGFGAFWEGIPCPGLPSVVLLFFPQSLWAGTSSPSQGREGRREAEREGGSSGGRDGGSQESQKAKRAGERGEEGMGKECSGEGGQRALCKEGVWGKYPGEVFHWSFY